MEKPIINNNDISANNFYDRPNGSDSFADLVLHIEYHIKYYASIIDIFTFKKQIFFCFIPVL